MFGSRPIIGCSRYLRWVVLLYIGFCTYAFCNASESYYVPDMYNCILAPRFRKRIVTRSYILVFLGWPDY
jgi:hypothetical protein